MGNYYRHFTVENRIKLIKLYEMLYSVVLIIEIAERVRNQTMPNLQQK